MAAGSSGDRIQVFGRRDSAETRRALRFFKERRMSVSMVDLAVRPPAPAELRRFIQGLGQDAVLDLSGRAYGEAGLAYLRLDEAGLLERLVRDPRLLRLPLVRWGQRVTAGPAEGAWRVWLDEARGRIPQ